LDEEATKANSFPVQYQASGRDKNLVILETKQESEVRHIFCEYST
jgi:hypothetical protein